MTAYVVTYSYPTWDRYYRGQRTERIAATSPKDALARIRRGEGRYGSCPEARLVRSRLAS